MDKAGTSLMTEEQYLESKGVGMSALGEPGLHRYPRRPSKSKDRSVQKLMLQRQNEWQEMRNKLREEYRQKVREGEVRPPSRVEKLLQTARGMPDNSAVQAARRILRGMGLWSDEMEKESDMNKIAVAKELVAVARMISGASKKAARNVFDVYLYENFSSGHPSLEVNLDIGIAAMQIGELVKRLKDAEDGAVNIIRSVPAKLSGVTMMVHPISLGVRATALCRLQLIPGASLDSVFNSLRSRMDTGRVEIR